jgi:hypothetical protein
VSAALEVPSNSLAMGLGIELQDEWGGKIDGVYDPKNLLSTLLPNLDETSHPMLSCIDPYGDTTFNRLQMRWFLPEWAEISRKVQTPEQQALVSSIEALAKRCAEDTHTYLKFIGD